MDESHRVANGSCGEGAGAVKRRTLGFVAELLLDPDLLGMSDTKVVVQCPLDEGDTGAIDHKTAFFDERDDMVDIVPAAGDAGADKATDGMNP